MQQRRLLQLHRPNNVRGASHVRRIPLDAAVCGRLFNQHAVELLRHFENVLVQFDVLLESCVAMADPHETQSARRSIEMQRQRIADAIHSVVASRVPE